MSLTVLVKTPDAAGSYALADRVTVGRAPENDIRIENIDVSRRHGSFEPTAGGAVFVDSGNAADSFRGFALKTGIGFGARWRSPVGPLNLDIAHGLDGGKTRLHFSVGLAF